MKNTYDSRIIFHIDVNSAFLSWSAVKRLEEDPGCVDLRTIPSVVGGDPTTRHGIVTAKSMPAKRYGIRTAETIASAMRRCPGLVVVPSDFGAYREYSHRFMELLRQYTDKVEQASIDEAYMDATELCADLCMELIRKSSGTPGSPDPAREAAVLLASSIRQEIREKLGFTVNVGISTNRLLAKMASDFEKPDKTHTLFPEEVPEKLWPLPIGDLYGCGHRTAERLRTLGIRTIGDAAHASLQVLTDHLGDKAGRYISSSARGIGRAVVTPVREDAKSYSNEWTTSSDIRQETYEAEFLPLLHHLCDKVAGRLQRDGVYGKTVSVTVKTDDFRRRSAQRRLEDPSNDAEMIYRTAAALSDRLLLGEKGLFAEGAGIRLVGAGVTDLDDGSFRQVNLFDWMTEAAEEVPGLNLPGSLMTEAEPTEDGTSEAAAPASLQRETEPSEEGTAASLFLQPEAEPTEEGTAEAAAPGSLQPEAESTEAERKRMARASRLQEMESAINRRFGAGTLRKGAALPLTDDREQTDQQKEKMNL